MRFSSVLFPAPAAIVAPVIAAAVPCLASAPDQAGTAGKSAR